VKLKSSSIWSKFFRRNISSLWLTNSKEGQLHGGIGCKIPKGNKEKHCEELASDETIVAR